MNQIFTPQVPTADETQATTTATAQPTDAQAPTTGVDVLSSIDATLTSMGITSEELANEVAHGFAYPEGLYRCKFDLGKMEGETLVRMSKPKLFTMPNNQQVMVERAITSIPFYATMRDGEALDKEYKFELSMFNIVTVNGESVTKANFPELVKQALQNQASIRDQLIAFLGFAPKDYVDNFYQQNGKYPVFLDILKELNGREFEVKYVPIHKDDGFVNHRFYMVGTNAEGARSVLQMEGQA